MAICPKTATTAALGDLGRAFGLSRRRRRDRELPLPARGPLDAGNDWRAAGRAGRDAAASLNLEGASSTTRSPPASSPASAATGISFPLADGETSSGRRVDFDSSELGIGVPAIGPAKQRLDWGLPVTREAGFRPETRSPTSAESTLDARGVRGQGLGTGGRGVGDDQLEPERRGAHVGPQTSFLA